MRPLLTGWAFLLLVITACSRKDRIPGDVLPPPKMQAVLWDMMRADQFLADYVLNRDTAKNKEKESIKLYSRIFTFHSITREEFRKSFDYYRTHPEQLQPLMDSMSKQNQEAPTKPVMVDTIKIADTNHGQAPPQVQPTTVPPPPQDTSRPFFRKTRKPFVPIKGD
jgi:hypothetical protein